MNRFLMLDFDLAQAGFQRLSQGYELSFHIIDKLLSHVRQMCKAILTGSKIKEVLQ